MTHPGQHLAPDLECLKSFPNIANQDIALTAGGRRVRCMRLDDFTII